MKRRLIPICVTVLGIAAAAAVPAATARAGARWLPAADPAWEQQGWHSVAPHASVLRSLLAARERPEDSAPAIFWLKGGARVPVLEQHEGWWRVGWTEGRSGWMRSRDLEPHASVVFIDARTGRVIRRIAAKGQGGIVADGKSLWSLADTGITRMVPGAEPAIWSQKFPATRDAPLPALSAWSRDGGTLFVRTGESGEKMAAVDARTGAVKILLRAGEGELSGIDGQGNVLITEMGGDDPHTLIYDPSRGAPNGDAPGRVVATSKSGDAYLVRGREMLRCGAGLTPQARISLPGDVDGACLSVDQRFVAVGCDQPGKTKKDPNTYSIRVLDARTLAPVVTLRADIDHGFGAPQALVADRRGWLVVADGAEDGIHATRYTRAGRPAKTWDGMHFAVRRDGRVVYLSDEKGLLVLNVADGKTRRFPYSWRRSLPARYLPKPADPEVPTHLEVSDLTLTPDGRTLLVTEWLDGDPHG